MRNAKHQNERVRLFYKGKYYNVLIKNHATVPDMYTVLITCKLPHSYHKHSFYKLENALKIALNYVSESHAVQITTNTRFV